MRSCRGGRGGSSNTGGTPEVPTGGPLAVNGCKTNGYEDRSADGADRTVASIESLLSLQVFAAGEWRPPIVKTEATTGKGIPELMEAIDRFRLHTAGNTGGRPRARAWVENRRDRR